MTNKCLTVKHKFDIDARCIHCCKTKVELQDQWDWELVINTKQRSLDYLKLIVQKIYDTIRFVEQQTCEFYPQITPVLPEKITFIHTEDLLTQYSNLSPQERENAICEKYGAVFLIGIG